MIRSLCHLKRVKSQLGVRAFHPSMVCFAKKSNKSKGSSANDESEVSELPDVKVFDTLMGKRISFFKDELVQVRGGSVSKDMLNSISVSAYGSKIPIEEAGQVSLKTSTSLSISVFDAALNPFVMTALRDAGMNLNPVQEGNTIIVSVPKPSKEAREVQVKLVSKMAEKVRVQFY